MEAPLLVFFRNCDGILAALTSALEKLPQAEQQLFFSLHNAHTGTCDPTFGIFQTNSFGFHRMFLIAFHASRFNHSCSPNARASWHAVTGTMRIFALRNIEAREEIFVSYLEDAYLSGSTRETRRKLIQKAWGFHCNCVLCSLPEPEATESDRRRTETTKIGHVLKYSPPTTPTRDKLILIKRMVTLFREENYSTQDFEYTSRAAMMCLRHSDWASSTYWARWAFNNIVDEEGIDSALAEDALITLLNPRSHPCAEKDQPEVFTDIRL